MNQAKTAKHHNPSKPAKPSKSAPSTPKTSDCLSVLSRKPAHLAKSAPSTPIFSHQSQNSATPSTSNHHFIPVQFGSNNVFLAPPSYLTHRPHSAPANPQLINQNNNNSLTFPSRSHPAIVKPIAIVPKTATNIASHNRELCRSMPNTPTSLSTCPYSLFAPQERNTNANSNLSARLNLETRTPAPLPYVIVPNTGHTQQMRSNSMSSQNKPNRSISVMPHSISYTPHSISYPNQSNMQLAINNLNDAYAVSQSISLPSHSRHGHVNVPQSIPNISHSIANMPHSTANMLHSGSNLYHSVANMPHSIGNLPHCMANLQYSGGNFSHSMASVPHSISVTSQMLPSQSYSVTSLSLPESSNYHRVTDIRKHRAVQMAKRLFLCKTKRKLVD